MSLFLKKCDKNEYIYTLIIQKSPSWRSIQARFSLLYLNSIFFNDTWADVFGITSHLSTKIWIIFHRFSALVSISSLCFAHVACIYR